MIPTAPIVMIGAGIGGLSAAIRLAAAGRSVVIVEKNAAVGGKMAQVEADGFRWDTGPSVITMRWVFDELFAAAGRRLEEYLTLRPIHPLTRYLYRDGTILDAVANLTEMAAAIERIEPRDVEGYLRFLADAARLHRITSPVFIESGPPSPASFRRAAPLDLLRIEPWLTLQQAIERRVRSQKLRMLLGRFATYVGANPWQAPAALAVIAHVELTGGVWYPQGGVYQIATALRTLAEELGVTVRTGCAVASIELRDGRATGVVLESGERMAASAVISNVDVTTTYSALLPPAPHLQARRAALARRESSCSGFVLLLGVEGEHPALAHHTILFSDDYKREFDDLFTRGVPPEDPTIYLAITSKSDPAHAPPGCENWFVLVNAPPAHGSTDWARQAHPYRDRVLATLARAGFDVRGRIRSERILTPLDLEAMSGAWRGALYGLSSNRALSAFQRPHNRCPDVAGLYFAGGTTHPGGGVPMVALSGKVAAQMVLEESR